VIGTDGLIVRRSGPWAEDKLRYVQHYAGIFTAGMAEKWSHDLAFLDLLAGPGMCRDADTGREFPGSPLLALRTKTPFRTVALVERDPECAAVLRRRVHEEPRAATAVVIEGDANAASTIAALRHESVGCLSFALVDLLGLDVGFETIAALTSERQTDLLFSFPEMDLSRNRTHALGADADRWTRFFGTGAWRPIVHAQRRDAVLRLLEVYRNQLATIGYQTKPLRLPLKNSRGGALYRPLFASKHPRGIDFFTKVSAIDPGGQQTLF
jgi:three-Cys-motif partner protein